MSERLGIALLFGRRAGVASLAVSIACEAVARHVSVFICDSMDTGQAL